MKDFEELVADAWQAPFSGWDFSWLKDREQSDPPGWDYRALAMARMGAVQSVLDMDTGGGEVFSNMGPFPAQTFASEGYAPNAAIAQTRLEPLGIRLMQVERNDQLPFSDEQLELVLNRHGSYSPGELWRVLKPGGRLLTQQVGGTNQMRLNQLLQEKPVHPYGYWTLDYARQQLETAGFQILDAREEFPETRFFDIGAVVYYLKAIPWQIEGFEPAQYLPRLAQIDEMIRRDGKLVTQQHRFLIEARKN